MVRSTRGGTTSPNPWITPNEPPCGTSEYLMAIAGEFSKSRVIYFQCEQRGAAAGQTLQNGGGNRYEQGGCDAIVSKPPRLVSKRDENNSFMGNGV